MHMQNSAREILGNQISFTPSIKVIPFSKYLSFHLGVVLIHANWANRIVLLPLKRDRWNSMCLKSRILNLANAFRLKHLPASPVSHPL